MKSNHFWFVVVLSAVLLPFMGCDDKKDGPDPGASVPQGVLYYSAADALVRYDFQSRAEITLFSEGDHYRVSPDATRFIWYKTDFGAGSSTVQIHSLSSPSEYETITLPYIVENTPQFVRGSADLFVALVRAQDGAVARKDLVLFSKSDVNIGRIPHVKDFVILPNGQDMVLSAEALNAQGEATGYALALVKNVRSPQGQETLTIQEYPDYAQLPWDLAASPDGQAIAFTHLDHLYTVAVRENAQPKAMTQSRFQETDAAWSADGRYLIFTGNVATSADCGEIRIIPTQGGDYPIVIPEDGVNNEPVDPLQPTDAQGKVIHACGSESYVWL